MQKIFYLSAAALTALTITTSCKDNNRIAAENTQVLPAVTAAEMAEFREWKEQKMTSNNRTTTHYNSAPARKPTVIKKTVYVTQPKQPVQAAEPVKKKGWSKAAKGTAIGAGAGAVAGAVIAKKNRALGAVIGGVVGGGVGYGIGRSMDKKDGRY